MKRVLIVSTGIADNHGLARLDESPEFRKATLNMKLAHLALQKALAPLASHQERFKTDMAMFLGTSHGEFNTTLDFLKSWAQQKLARPFVFQNSLHNSTTGFVGLTAGYKGPSCTSSHHYFSGEDALDLASQFIKTGMTQVASVLGIDTRIGSHLPMMKEAGFPHAGWGQGSGCVILASEDYARAENLPVLGDLRAVDMHPCLDRPVYWENPEFDLTSFYDSHAVEVLARAIENRGPGELTIEKPNGGHSRLSWAPV